jgi:hypothetical protein
MYSKTHYIVVLVIVGFIVGSAFIGLSKVRPDHEDYRELWEGEPDVKNCPLEPPWFSSEEAGAEHQECLEVAEMLKSLIESRKYETLNSVILPPVPDVQNNVVYLLVSPDTASGIRELVDAQADVEICFIEAPAPREVLFEWAEYVYGGVEVLRDRKGVEIWSAGITLNGTIYVGMEEVNPRNVNVLLSYLEGFVPPGILVIRQDGPHEDT